MKNKEGTVQQMMCTYARIRLRAAVFVKQLDIHHLSADNKK
ncbi:MAG: hypothetical protein ABF868_07360 [Sporolactobacillus sp.]